jgi:hypothetical protein
VLSGDWYFGYGREFDGCFERNAGGKFLYRTPGEHFGQARPETIIEITGYGPTN